MKTQLIALLALFAVPAFAVQVKNCPENLVVSYGKVSVTTSIQKIQSDSMNPVDDKKIDSIVTILSDLESNFNVSLELPRTSSGNGRCKYEGNGNTKIEIYSKNGKDLLYVQTESGLQGILYRTYAKIDSISPKRIDLASEDASVSIAVPRIGYNNYLAGGPLVFVGKTGTFKISAN